MAREYKMVRRQEKVAETRRRIAKATYELHATIGPAFASVAMIAERAGLPRQTVYRNFGTQADLFRSCVAYGLELHPLPDPDHWACIPHGRQRLRTGLTELYAWFGVTESVMANSIRDSGVIQDAAQQSMAPVVTAFARMYEVLSDGWDVTPVAPLLSLSLDFATWRKLRREHAMNSAAIVDMWLQLIACRNADGYHRTRRPALQRAGGRRSAL